MAEIILGVGRQSDARKAVDLVYSQLLGTEGPPRKVVLRAPNIEITAERQDFEAPFSSFVLRARLGERSKQTVDAAVAELDGACSIAPEGEWYVIECPPKGQEAAESTEEALRKLSEYLNLPEVWRAHGENYRIEHISTELLFQAMIQYRASDVHLAPGETPVFRIDGETRHSDVMGVLSATQILALIRELTSDDAWKEFKDTKQVSFN